MAWKCDNCGTQFDTWLATCSECLADRSFVPAPIAPRGQWTRRRRGGLVSASELASTEIISIPLSPAWKTVYDRLPWQHAILFWGPPGGGKTSLLIQQAGELARHGKVLYLSAESGQGDEIREKCARLEMRSQNVLFSSAIDVHELAHDIDAIPGLKFLIIDSVNCFPISLLQMSELVEERRLGCSIAMHATKDGKIKGDSGWAHFVDIVLKVENLRWNSEKNRFGPLRSGDILAPNSAGVHPA